jgi:manganese transport protein
MKKHTEKVGALTQTTDAKTISEAEKVLSGKSKKNFFARILPFLGPAFIACVAYMDPGNFATNIQGGAQFGYTLLWVVILCNGMAMLIQVLSAKLGIATGFNLAEQCRRHFPKYVVIGMWIIMEIVAMATDLAEFLGAAIGFYLLFGMPLWIAGLVTAVVTFLILALETYGFRPLEAIITSLVGVIAVCYVIETFMSPPDMGQLVHGAVFPRFQGPESVLLATGILGATVMPHVIFLHSALTQGRIITRNKNKLQKLIKFEMIDVIVAMGLAGFINAAMLIMAATTFHKQGMSDVGSIEQAYQTLTPLLGSAAGTVFAISLLASGISSSAVGTMSGQVIMQGFIRRRIPVWVRRLITIIPSLFVIFMGFDPTRTLVMSQVVLSFGLPFAVIPLVIFTSNKKIMGVLVNMRGTTIAAWIIASMIVALNIYLLTQTIFGG